jgi:hypothetical protein
MPPQDGSGRDQLVRPQGSGQVPDQRGKDSTVGPVHAGPWLRPPQHRDLMAQDEQLGVLGCWGSAKKDEPCGDPGKDQVQQAHRHGRSSCPPTAHHLYPQVTTDGRPLASHRYRLARWEADWLAVEPQWTNRR